jgi:outer membrane protein
MMKKGILFIVFFIWSSIIYSQDTITLQFCIDSSKKNMIFYASENRIINQSELNLKYNKWSLLPSIAGSSSFNTSFGRRVDPFTNTFATNTVNSQSFGLSTNIPIFNGFNYFYTKNKFQIEKEKSELSLKQRINDNSLKVIELYVELCNLQIQKDLARLRIEKYQQLQVVQKSLLKGGKINAVDTLKSYNSLLNEESKQLSLTNQLNQKSIDLNYIIGLPLIKLNSYSKESIINCREEIECTEEFDESLIELEMNALQEQLGIDRSRILPSLSISGSLGTGYSTNNKDYAVSGNPTLPYNEQINKNLYEGIGVNLNIPIFNKGTYLKARQLSELSKTELVQRKELKTLEVDKRKLQNEEQLSYLNSEIFQLKTVTNNLRQIYEKTFLLYKEGKITYREVETAFLEWQNMFVECKKRELDFAKIKLVYGGMKN